MPDLTSFANVISLLAAVAGIISAVATVWAERRARRELTSATAAVGEDRANVALTSNDLETFGTYLYEQLGRVTLDNYARDSRVRERLDHVVRRVAEFVEPEGERQRDSDKTAATADMPVWSPEILYLIQRHALGNAEGAVREGNVWNGLAELRRQIEVRLRQFAQIHDLPAERVGARRLLNSLIARKAIPEDSRALFEYAINVANRGVHGEEVSTHEALAAIVAGAQALDYLPTMRGTA